MVHVPTDDYLAGRKSMRFDYATGFRSASFLKERAEITLENVRHDFYLREFALGVHDQATFILEQEEYAGSA